MPITIDSRTVYRRTADGKMIPVPALRGEKGEKGDTGATGERGEKGERGQDAVVTSESVVSALGFTPANQTDVTQLNADIADETARAQAEEQRIEEVIVQTVEPLQKQADNTDRKQNALWKLSEGQVYDIQQQEESGMNDAPSGAKFLTLDEVRGKTEQDSTNGYNLFDFSTAVFRAQRGVVSILNEDGSISFKGLFTETGYGGDVDLEALELNGTYTFSTDRVLPYDLAFVPSDWSTPVIIQSGTKSGSITVSSKKFKHVVVKAQSGDAVDMTVNLMLEKGSTAHPYEPYTGGIPSPNPYYPQEIKSVESFTVKSVGKNLLDYHDYVARTAALGITAEHDGHGTYHIFGTSTGNVTLWARGNYENKTPLFTLREGTYHLTSGCVLYDFTGDTRVTKSGVIQLTEPFNVTGIVLYGLYTVGTTVDITVSPQLELGAVETAFEPFDGRSRTITPPRPLNKIGDYADICDVDTGVWKYATDTIAGVTWESRGYDVEGSQLFSVPSPNANGNNYLPYRVIVSNKVTHTGAVLTENVNGAYCGYGFVFCRLKDVSDQTEFNQLMSGYKVVYLMVTDNVLNTISLPIDPADLDFLRSLSLTPADHHITITDQNGEDVSWLAEYIAENARIPEVADLVRRTDNLGAAAEGNLYREDVDTTAAYEKRLSAGVLPWAKLDSIGGHTEVVDGALTNYSTEAVVSSAGQQLSTFALAQKYFPNGMKSVGDVHDELDLNNKIAVQRVGAHTFDGSDTFTWFYTNIIGSDEIRIYSDQFTSVKAYDGATQPNMMCAEYPVRYWNLHITRNDASVSTLNGQYFGITHPDLKGVLAGIGTPTEKFNKWLAQHPVTVYYELTEPIITPITEDFSTELRVEAGGSLTFVNDQHAAVPVPNQETFLMRVSAGVKSVSVAGTALVPDADGNVNVPVAGANEFGVVKASPSFGIAERSAYIGANVDRGFLQITPATEAGITNRNEPFRPITADWRLDHAVRAGLISNSRITDADKPLICETIGAAPYYNWEHIDTITINSTDSVDIDLIAEPDGTPYNFDQVFVQVMLKQNAELSNYGQVFFAHDSKIIVRGELGNSDAQNVVRMGYCSLIRFGSMRLSLQTGMGSISSPIGLRTKVIGDTSNATFIALPGSQFDAAINRINGLRLKGSCSVDIYAVRNS